MATPSNPEPSVSDVEHERRVKARDYWRRVMEQVEEQIGEVHRPIRIGEVVATQLGLKRFDELPEAGVSIEEVVRLATEQVPAWEWWDTVVHRYEVQSETPMDPVFINRAFLAKFGVSTIVGLYRTGISHDELFRRYNEFVAQECERDPQHPGRLYAQWLKSVRAWDRKVVELLNARSPVPRNRQQISQVWALLLTEANECPNRLNSTPEEVVELLLKLPFEAWAPVEAASKIVKIEDKEL